MSSPTPRPATRPAVILAIALVAISLSAIFVRLADAPGVVVAFWRMAVASLVMLPLTVRAIRRTPPGARNLWPTAAAGFLLAVHFAAWISSLSYTTVAASVTMVSTTPLWVALLAWAFLRQAPTLTTLIGVLLAVAGGAIIGFGGSSGADAATASAPLLGDGLALLGGLAMAGYLLLGRLAQRRGLGLDAYAGSAYSVAALCLLPLPLLFGYDYLGYPAATFAWVVALALVPQLIGHTGINHALRHMGPTRVATATLLEPLGAGLLAFLLFQEAPGPLTLLGAVVLLTGVVLTVRGSRAAPATGGSGQPAGAPLGDGGA